jgi:hypothetical protein
MKFFPHPTHRLSARGTPKPVCMPKPPRSIDAWTWSLLIFFQAKIPRTALLLERILPGSQTPASSPRPWTRRAAYGHRMVGPHCLDRNTAGVPFVLIKKTHENRPLSRFLGRFWFGQQQSKTWKLMASTQ